LLVVLGSYAATMSSGYRTALNGSGSVWTRAGRMSQWEIPRSPPSFVKTLRGFSPFMTTTPRGLRALLHCFSITSGWQQKHLRKNHLEIGQTPSGKHASISPGSA